MKYRGFSCIIGLLGLGHPANAAELPLNWSGLYIGIQGGLNWGKSQVIQNDPAFGATIGLPITDMFSATGGVLGASAGYNWQVGRWVLGLEGDLSLGNLRGSKNNLPPLITTFVDTTESKWLATARARLGATLADQKILYITGGPAGAGVTAAIDTNSNRTGVVSETSTVWGGAFGGGLEGMVDGGWSIKAEYLYVWLPTKTYFSPDVRLATGTVILTRSIFLNENVLRIGTNYRF